MVIIQNNEIHEDKVFDEKTIDFILKTLISKYKVNDKEIEYVHKLFQRAKSYQNAETYATGASMYMTTVDFRDVFSFFFVI